MRWTSRRQVAVALLFVLSNACGGNDSAPLPGEPEFDAATMERLTHALGREFAEKGSLDGTPFGTRLAEATLEELRHGVSADPTKLEPLRALADALIEYERWKEALEVLARIQPLVPEDAAAHVLAARANYELGLADEEGRALARAVELEPECLRWRVLQLEALAEAHRYAEAAEVYARLVKQGFAALARPEPRRPYAWVPLAETPPHEVEAIAHLYGGRSELLLGRPEKARDSFEACLRALPEEAEAQAGLGAALLQLGLDARAALQRARELDPERADVISDLALELLEADLPSEALRATDLALALDPEHPAAHNHRGWALFELGRTSEALAAHERALALREAFPEAHHNRGVTLEALGRPAEARAAYARALELAPDRADTRQRSEALDGDS
jgi:tetratricopeptide (TPR) repeat protein